MPASRAASAPIRCLLAEPVIGVPTCLHGAVIIRECDGQRKARPFAEPSREGASDPRYHRRRWPLVLLATKEFFRSQSSLANVDLKYGRFLRPPPESVTALDQRRRQCTTPRSVVAAVFPLVCPCKEKNDTFPQCAVAYRSEPRCTDGGETDHLKHRQGLRRVPVRPQDGRISSMGPQNWSACALTCKELELNLVTVTRSASLPVLGSARSPVPTG